RPSRHFNLLKGLIRCRQCERSVRGNYQPAFTSKNGVTRVANWMYICTGIDEAPKICSLPAFNGNRVEDAVWTWLVNLITNPQLVEAKLQARQAELAQVNATHIERVDTIDSLIAEKRAERARYISMAGRKLITEDELEALAGRLVKDIAGLELQKAKAQERIETSFTDEQIAAIVADSQAMAETREDFITASDEVKRRNLERYHVRVELEAPADKVRIVHASCVLGSDSLNILFGKNVHSSVLVPPPTLKII
ncbi:MAG: recombinase zinc beta ribbon domain-containing protein, partial [Roseiflexaceae bacterium]